MPITKQKLWEKCIHNNRDQYGKAVIDVSRQVMKILDADPKVKANTDLIRRASRELKAGLSGFQAGGVISTVKGVHSRGKEFEGIKV